MNKSVLALEVLLDKINLLYQNIAVNPRGLDAIELDLLKRYTAEWYEGLLSLESSVKTAGNHVADIAASRVNPIPPISPEGKSSDSNHAGNARPASHMWDGAAEIGGRPSAPGSQSTQSSPPPPAPPAVVHQVLSIPQPPQPPVTEAPFEQTFAMPPAAATPPSPPAPPATTTPPAVPAPPTPASSPNKPAPQPEPVKASQNSAREQSADVDLNARFARPEKDLAQTLVSRPDQDLLRMIDVNERFLFTAELFQGNSDWYGQAIRKLNEKSNLQEALNYLDQELASKFSWNVESKVVMHLRDLVEQRYGG